MYFYVIPWGFKGVPMGFPFDSCGISRNFFEVPYFFPSNAFMAFARSFNKFVLAGN